jgi:hypothetical protein
MDQTSSLFRLQVNHILTEFAISLGVKNYELTAEGHANLELDDVPVALMLDDTSGTLVLLSSLGKLEESPEAYGRLLDANLFWKDTAGATLARNPDTRSIVIHRPLSVESLDYPRFCNVLLEFVQTCENLRSSMRTG